MAMLSWLKETVTHRVQYVMAAGLLYFVLAIGCISLSSTSIQTTIWIPNAILLVFILRSHQQYAWYYLLSGFVANVAANMLMGAPPSILIGFAAANAVELIPPIICYRVYVHHCMMIHHPNKLLTIFFMSLLLGCFISAGTAGLLISEYYKMPYPTAAFLWLSTDMFALLAILPIALSATVDKFKSFLSSAKLLEFILLFAISAVTVTSGAYFMPSPFIIISLPLLYAALRFKFFGTSLLIMLDSLLFVVVQYTSPMLHSVYDYHAIYGDGYFLMSLTVIAPTIISLLLEQRETYEEKMRESEERLNITLHSIGEAVLTLNADGKINFMNPIAEEWLGCKLSDVAGLEITDVCKLMSEKTNLPLPDPIYYCKTEGETLYVKEDGVLVNRKGKIFNIHYSAAPLYTKENELLGCVMVLQDMTVYRQMQSDLKHQATHDDLTGLINRREFEAILSTYINDLRPSKAGHTLCYLDLDRFKIVNDTAGHDAGDELLRNVSAIIKQHVRATDVVARLGGDEFAVILPECALRNGYATAEKIIAAIHDYVLTWKDQQYSVGVSAGITTFMPHASTQEEVMSHADVACYAAKHQGGNTVVAYAESGEVSHYHAEFQFVSSIKQAIELNRFKLYSREVKSLTSNDNTRPTVELLIRMIDEKNNILMPAQFLATAERHGLMMAIDQWVVTKVLIEFGGDIANRSGMGVSINLSANAIASPKFLGFLKETLAKTPIPKYLIGFELSERAILNDIDNAYELLSFLRSQECYVSLDDFGSAISSFNHLKKMSVRYIKIDGNLVRHIDKNANDLAIVEAINQLAHKLNIKTIAEYVENEAILQIVKRIGVDYAEGDAIGKALPFTEMLDNYPIQMTHL